MIRFVALLLLLSALPVAAQRSSLTLRGYRVVFEDDFRYPSVADMLAPATRRWSPEHSWGMAHRSATMECGDYSAGSYAFLASNIALAPDPAEAGDQCLALHYGTHTPPLHQVTAEDGTVTRATLYRTGSMLRALYAADTDCPISGFRYGIFEMRAKVPRTEGLQAAFWMWNGPNACSDTMRWRPGQQNEIDILETYRTQAQRTFFSTLQASPFINHQAHQAFTAWQGADPADDFHVYVLAWTPTQLAWFVDGHLTHRVQTATPAAELHLLLSADFLWDCAGNRHCNNEPPCPAPNDPFLIDYVRVYKPTKVGRNGRWPAIFTQPNPLTTPVLPVVPGKAQ
ncbi:glycoside hydrolase family 16 protein [Hymenobacter weizhouensis]|uniref:glycoside hydrolase family 16 protein n=1 Tax=Hymenobacter sp. YIM 151500-1 TaxID=2987689 RepID=UPI002225E859|nr:glycoside hydrolase family 16 protein [Hymenobacter sp. YIM 151500-1]UYZ62946.1 glycoside hydrolase family 16 protein [Hymenobacter sp. YIM 151500-1]